MNNGEPTNANRWPTAFLVLLALVTLAYSFHIGSWSLDDSEAYSALAASQRTLAAVVQCAERFDPGKPPLYQILLHWFTGFFGSNEVSLRTPSVIFALGAMIVLYSLGSSLCGPEASVAAAVIWILNPLAFILGQWARMYALFTFAVVLDMWAFWWVRDKRGGAAIGAFTICGALMLYAHLCGLLFAAVQVAMLTRDFYRGRWALAPWVGIVAACALFVPFLPTAIAQARGMLFTHWLDWIGAAHAVSAYYQAAIALAAAAMVLGLIFGPRFETDDREPVRFCAMWLLIPLVGLSAVSVIVRPVFSPRYIAPAAPALALLIASGAALFGAKVRNLTAVGFATAFAVLFVFYRAHHYEPWPEVAQQVLSAGRTQPVFFESGLVVRSDNNARETTPGFISGFPLGYFRVPFDHYFNGPNPRGALDPSNPRGAREMIAEAALGAGGAWLISGKIDVIAQSEMPNSGRFRIHKVLQHDYTSLYHIVPLTQPQR
jgi:mannosyltransferase